MGNLGGGIATYVTENIVEFKNDDYRKLVVLSGMSAALGAYGYVIVNMYLVCNIPC